MNGWSYLPDLGVRDVGLLQKCLKDLQSALGPEVQAPAQLTSELWSSILVMAFSIIGSVGGRTVEAIQPPHAYS